MEHLQDTPKRTIFNEILFIAAICLLTVFTSLGLILILMIPALFAFFAVRRGYLTLLGAGAVVLVICIFYWGLTYSALFLLMILPPFVVLTYMNKRKQGSFEWLLAVCGSMLVSIALIAVFVYLRTGKDIVSAVCDEIGRAFELAQPGSAEYDMMAVLGYVDSLEDIFTVSISSSLIVDKAVYIPKAIGWIRVMLNAVLPSIILSISLFGGLFNFLFTRFMIRKSLGEVKEMKPFAQWEIPARGVWGLLIVVMTIGAGSILGIELFGEAMAIVLELLVMVFLIQGTAFVLFLLQRRGAGIFFKAIMFIFLFLFFGTVIVICGIAEQFLKLRKKMVENDKTSRL
ncbi:MAG: DUF2232 domain-containing protein [Christensenellales bacterium]